MQIEKIELRYVKLELVSPFTTSMGTEYNEEHIIIRIDGEGLTGWGECVAGRTPFYSYETVKTAWQILDEYLIPAVLNKNISGINEAICAWEKVRGHRMAKAGLEAALWDLLAKSEGKSLSQILGGSREKIDVGVSIGIQENTDLLIKKVEEYLQEGYKRIKIKISPGSDIELVKALRKNYPDILLQVDANSAFKLSDLEIFKELDQFNLVLIEQPLGYNDLYEHSKLQQKLQTPICLDESISSFDDALTAIKLGSCRIINLKPGRVGGFTEAKRIHNLCAEHNIPVWCGGMLELGIGRAGNVALASLPNFTLPGDISASRRYYKEDIVEPLFEINTDGTMDVPTKPGIGVDVVMINLENVTLQKKIF